MRASGPSGMTSEEVAALNMRLVKVRCIIGDYPSE